MKSNNIDNSSYYKKLVEVLSIKEIENILHKERVIMERVELIYSFIIDLTKTINNTYLGKDYIKTDDDILGHYKWSFNNIGNKYLEQDIKFSENSEVYDYFYEYFLVSLYQNCDYHESYLINDWSSIFSLREKKLRIDLNRFIDIYKIFNQTFINKLYE
jgi:hypothetical protein